MTKKSLLTLAVLAALGGTAAAQVPVSDAQFAAQLEGIRIQAATAGQKLAAGVQMRVAQKSEPQGLLSSVMVAMADAPGTGELLVTWLREKGAVVEFRGQAKGRSGNAWLDGKPAVYLDPSVAAEQVSYRYVAVHVAKETAELMLKDFPDSAERRYIASSRVAETFFELGGTRMTMGAMDGHQDAAMEETIRLWVEHDPASGVSFLKGRGVPTLAEVRAKAASEALRLGDLIHIINDQMLVVPGDPNAESLRAEAAQCGVDREKALKTVAAVDAALKEFEAFKAQEKDWLWTHQGTLQ